MSLPIQVQSQLSHFKSRLLALVAAQVFSVVMVSRLFGISRKTFYRRFSRPENDSHFPTYLG
jgi:transcriptional regulator of acetoin/glycerol metabolism